MMKSKSETISQISYNIQTDTNSIEYGGTVTKH